MVSINTNLSSLMVQGNLTNSTNGLNKAIERLSTGYKINHSSDNAANYSIANSYESKLSSYDMAASNVSMGLDLLSVAQDTISTMQDHGSRLHALITQAHNGTYGAQSLTALTQEAGALISEINRMYSNAEYNGISLFDSIKLPDWAKEVKANVGLTKDLTPKANGFIEDIETVTPDVVVSEASELADAIANNSVIGIKNAGVLAKLATLVNGGTSCSGKTIVLTDDIDLSDYQAGEGWTTIGTEDHRFLGIFDGQGHKVTGLKINKSSTDNQGLFGYTSASSEIKNLSVTGDVKGNSKVGVLVGLAIGKITNCHTSGSVVANSHTGGIVGTLYSNGQVSNCYSEADISSASIGAGGLAGQASGSITNSFTTGNVSCASNRTGGLLGTAYSTAYISNCYAKNNIIGKSQTGGIVGRVEGATIEHCDFSGSVFGIDQVGGIIGYGESSPIMNYCHSSGDVKGTSYIGGIAGWTLGKVKNCYSEADVSGNSDVGGICGYMRAVIQNVIAEGNITGTKFVGGIVGNHCTKQGFLTYTNCFSSCSVSGNFATGSFIGGIYTEGASFNTSRISVTNCTIYSENLNLIDGCYSTKYRSSLMDIDLSPITDGKVNNIEYETTNIQAGIYGDESNKISFSSGFKYNLNSILRDITSDKSYNAINSFMSTLSAKATELGSASNRLESSMESILVNMENVTSSLSTIKDADMAKTSSQYIRMQILQEASATLLATANQSPSIALQLI